MCHFDFFIFIFFLQIRQASHYISTAVALIGADVVRTLFIWLISCAAQATHPVYFAPLGLTYLELELSHNEKPVL